MTVWDSILGRRPLFNGDEDLSEYNPQGVAQTEAGYAQCGLSQAKKYEMPSVSLGPSTRGLSRCSDLVMFHVSLIFCLLPSYKVCSAGKG